MQTRGKHEYMYIGKAMFAFTNQNDDEEAPFSQFPGTTCALDSLVELHVALFRILEDIGGLHLSLLDWSFLQHDSFSKVLEELVQLNKSALNLLNVVVSCADGTKYTLSSSRSVGFELY